MTELEAYKLLTRTRNGEPFDINMPREQLEELCLEINTAVNMALDALNKQIPKKINVINSIHHYCPSCDLYFDSRDWKSKYCGRCGQALKWE